MNRGGWNDGAGGMGGVSFPRLTQAVKLLMIVNGAVALLQLIWFMSTGDTFYQLLGTSLDKFLGNPIYGVLSLFTYQFVHDARNLWHIFGNLLVLYFFGTMVEARIGTKALIWLYLACGVAGGLFWWLFSALTGQGMVPCVGASGAAYGILTYAAFMAPMSLVILILFPVRLWVVAALFGGFALYSTLIALRLGGGGGDVAHAAHVGGALLGAWVWWKRDWIRGLGYRLANAGRERERRRQRSRAERLDRLLRKIKEAGMTGLSKAERRFLSRYSKDKRDQP